MEDLGGKISKYRKDRGITQKELAKLLHVSSQLISKWETNQATPGLDYILELCQIFEISIEQLVSKEIKEVKDDVKQNKPKKIKRNKKFIIGGVVAGCFSIAIILTLLIIFVFIPHINKLDYLLDIGESIINRIEADDYFNIEVNGYIDDEKKSTKIYQGYFDESGVNFTDNKVYIVDNIKYCGSYKEVVDSQITTTKDLYINMSSNIDDFNFRKEDIEYIRKTSKGYYLELNPEFLTRNLGSEAEKQISVKSKLTLKISILDNKCQSLDMQIVVKDKVEENKYTIKSSLVFKNEKPDIVLPEALRDVPWKVESNDNDVEFLKIFFSCNDVVKLEDYSADYQSVIETALNNDDYYVYNDKIWMFNGVSSLVSFDINDLTLVDNISLNYAVNSGVIGYGNKIVYCSTSFIFIINLDTGEITQLPYSATTTIEFVDISSGHAIFKEQSMSSHTQIIFVDLDSESVVLSGDVHLASDNPKFYIKNNYLYINCYGDASYDNYYNTLYKFSVLTAEKTYISRIAYSSLEIIYINDNEEIYYSCYNDNFQKVIRKVGTTFEYNFGHQIVEKDNLIYIYLNDQYGDSYIYKYSGETLVLSEINTHINSIYNQPDVVYVDGNNNVYMKGKTVVYHGSYDNFTSIEKVFQSYGVSTIHTPCIMMANENYIIAIAPRFNVSFVEDGREFFCLFLYNVNDLSKPLLSIEINKTSVYFLETNIGSHRIIKMGDCYYKLP
ncbi:MAG: helix-turn-helix transcriptional regulator [Clostridiales bacterium]|nr:helix-turn-helix transcriptional regulator [Clostridiales bacterium]